MSKKPFNQKLKGGLADNKKPSDFDQKQLNKGIKTELEHTDDKNLAKEIAMDHMVEDKKYYTHLQEMEKKYKKAFNLKKAMEVYETENDDVFNGLVGKKIPCLFIKNQVLEYLNGNNHTITPVKSIVTDYTKQVGSKELVELPMKINEVTENYGAHVIFGELNVYDFGGAGIDPNLFTNPAGNISPVTKIYCVIETFRTTPEMENKVKNYLGVE